MMIYADFNKKMLLHIQKKVFLLFVSLKVFKLLSKCDKFQVNKYHAPIQKKKYDWVTALPPPLFSVYQVKIRWWE